MKRAAALVLAILIPASVLAVNFTYVPQDPVKRNNLGVQIKLKINLKNLEPTAEDFTIIREQDLTSDFWTSSICLNQNCFAPFMDTVVVTVQPGVTDTVKLYVNTTTEHGSANALMRAIPVNDPGNEKSQVVAAITNGVDVLVVDDDGGEAYHTYYTDALPAGTVHGRWPRVAEAPTSTDLNQFGEVVWFTGEASPSLDSDDRTALTGFLTGGGKLLLSGQNIAYSLCDPASAEYSAGACSFVTGYLRATYGANNSGSTNVVGSSRDPIGGGLSFSIAGGAGNQSSPDGVAPNGGYEALQYDGTAHSAAVHSFSGNQRVVYFAFGLEGITSLSTRQTIMERVFDYFTATVGVADAGVPRPEILSANRPNPFNPSTSLTVRLDRAETGSVSVFDAGGRHVRTLADGLLAAGETELVWHGTDDGGNPVRSGVYFVRVEAGERALTRKVSLVR
ncbi:MAG: FlgD immunoglobulin-like domain containing protein [Candidatus Eisenbacteria bacterium]